MNARRCLSVAAAFGSAAGTAAAVAAMAASCDVWDGRYVMPLTLFPGALAGVAGYLGLRARGRGSAIALAVGGGTLCAITTIVLMGIVALATCSA